MSNVKKRIVSVEFDPLILRSGRSGDNWSMTWADDDCLYTSCDDGWGWDYTATAGLFNGHPVRLSRYNNRVWRLEGGPYDFNPQFIPTFPYYNERDEWYGYGIISVDGTIYHYITCASDNGFFYPFRGTKLLYTEDHGQYWYLHNGKSVYNLERNKAPENMLFWCEGDDYAFANIEVLQCGKDNAWAKDNYIYLYSPNGRYHYHQLNCARVAKDKIRDRSAYEFFKELDSSGEPVWVTEIHQRGSIHEFPDHYGWYSWLPSVVYNKGLDLYIMANGGTGVNGSDMHELPASLGIYYAEKPWGPWKEACYTAEWVADKPANRLYQPKLSPKWISDDGKEMFLIFSDASDEWGYQYRWNQQRIILNVL